MYIYRVWSVCSCCEHVFKMHSVARFPSHQNMTKNYLMHRRGALNCQKVYCSNTQYISIEEMLIDLPWEDEKGPSSISPTLELFQGQHCVIGKTPEIWGGAHMGLPERIDTIVNCTVVVSCTVVALITCTVWKCYLLLHRHVASWQGYSLHRWMWQDSSAFKSRWCERFPFARSWMKVIVCHVCHHSMKSDISILYS